MVDDLIKRLVRLCVLYFSVPPLFTELRRVFPRLRILCAWLLSAVEWWYDGDREEPAVQK